MSCDQVRPELDSLSRGELDGPAEKEVKRHLATCAGCRRELASVERVARALHEAPVEPIDADALADKVIARARRERAPSTKPAAVGLLLAGILGAGAVVVVARYKPPVEPAPTPTRAPFVTAPAVPEKPPSDGNETPPDEVAPVPSLPPLPPPPESIAERPTDTAPRVEVATPAKEEPAPVALACRVATVRGEARVRHAGAGATDWQPLSAGATLAPDDEVSAQKGSLELAFARGNSQASLGLDRLVLAEGARATLGKGARIEAGSAFASTTSPLLFAIGKASVTLEGDAAFSLKESCEVSLHSGRASVKAVETKDLRVGERVAIDREGKLGAVSAAGDPPSWLAAHRAIEASRVVFTYPSGPAGPLLVGERRGALVSAGAIDAKGPGTRVVCLGTGDARGLLGHEAGLRLRLRYRLARSVPLGLQITDRTQGRDFQAVVAAPRAGDWTTIELELDGLAEAARTGKRLAAGDRLDIVTFSAHGNDPKLAFEIAEVVIYRAK